MLVSDFHFNLPEELIAQHPPAEARNQPHAARRPRQLARISDDHFRNLPSICSSPAIYSSSTTRAYSPRVSSPPAPACARNTDSPGPTGRIEVLLTQQVGPYDWSTLVRPSRKVQPGERLSFGEGLLSAAELISAGEFGERTLRFAPNERFFEHLEAIGHMPLPPYIHRDKDEA